MGSKSNDSANDACSPQAGLHVLVADDNTLNQDLTVRMLSRAGHTADVVNDGAAALEALEGMAYDVVLVDMMMPGLSGLDVIRRYRESFGRDRPLPFVVLTANATKEAAELAKEAGAAAYLTKPIQPKTLRMTIEKVVNSVHDEAQAVVPDNTAAVAALEGQPLIDEEVFAETIGLMGDRERAKGLVERFCSDTEHLITQIASAVREGRLTEIRDLAHAMKGSAAYLGAVRMVIASEYLQRATPPDLETTAVQALGSLEDVYRETREELFTRMT
ncbi:MAG: response regulator [Gammaproteobacteria bacterium]